MPRISSAAAIGAARADGGARVAAAQGSDWASLVLFPTGRGARLAWKTFTWPSTQQLNLSVVDAATGAVLYRQSLSSDATGTATAWEFYPSDLVPAGANTANPITFPVDDGTRLFGPNAHVWSDVKDNNKPDAGEEISAVSGTNWSMPAILNTSAASQNCTTARPCTWDRGVPFSWQANQAQNAAQVMYYLNRYHDHLATSPYGFTSAAGNFENADRVLGKRMDGANSGNGLPDQNHFNNANMGTPPDGHSPTMQMYLFHADAGHPAAERERRGRRGGRLPRVHARSVEPAGPVPGRHVRPLEPAGQLDGRGLERLVCRGLPEQPRVQAGHGHRR